MPTNGDQFDQIVGALQERAKELECLYRVDELLGRADAAPADVFRGLAAILPAGWQHPAICRARVTVGDTVYRPADFRPGPLLLRAPVTVNGQIAGMIEVFYTELRGEGGAEAFLPEERRLLDAIADRLGQYLARRRLEGALAHDRAVAPLGGERRHDWWVIVDLLRQTDRRLLIRLSRKMLNHLCWNGIESAQDLLFRLAPKRARAEDVALDDNRPIEKKSEQDLLLLTDETFRIAAAHLSGTEIVSRIQKWIKDDQSAFLLEALEDRGSTVPLLTEAIQRFRTLGIDESELTFSVRTAMSVSLLRRFFSDELEFINHAKHHVGVSDCYDLSQRIISPPNGHGTLGGKSAGLFVAGQIVRRSHEYADLLSDVKLPRTWYITSDATLDFIRYNHLEDVYNRKYLELDQVRREYPHIVQVFKNSQFPQEIVKGLSMALDDYDGVPLIVRSSSLLEDRTGAAFSGKYKSLFLANQGPKKERLSALQDAIAEVYASIFGPDPLEYRAERGLLDLHEEMGIMIQEVIGRRVGDYFLPAFSGVAFSNNEFRWSPRIKREDGLLRLVLGLGTRAVDRVVDDYPILIAPGQRGLRANVTPEEVLRYSPKMVDLINLRTREFATMSIAALLRECGAEYPMIEDIVSIASVDGVRAPMPFEIDFERDDLVVTLEGLISRTPFVPRMRALLKLLADKLGAPVDLEFAHDGQSLYLLQCRPQSAAPEAAAAPIPSDLPADRLLFTASRYVSNCRVPDLSHIVYVDPSRYGRLPDLDSLRAVGRIVGKLNKLLPRRHFILMGPGRWGSRGDIRLGVSVTYSEINNSAMLVEIARKEGSYVPDLSFGTHFFQDLVEAAIGYLPLYPDEGQNVLNEGFLLGAMNHLASLLPDAGGLADTIRVIDVPEATGGLVLRVLANADLDRAAGILVAPGAPGVDRSADRWRDGDEVQGRWRLRVLERLAAEIDPARFGVKGLYAFGSTATGTGGGAGEVELLVHFDGTDAQRRELEGLLHGFGLALAETSAVRRVGRGRTALAVHFINDDDIALQSPRAALLEAARPLRMGPSAAT